MIEINNLTEVEVNEDSIKNIVSIILKTEKREGDISIAFIGSGRMRKLNKKYRKSNKVTDVLAFDYGEIFICLSQAKKQAKKLGHSLKEELAILLIHGILHLTGYKDKTKKDLNKMLKKQREICQKII